MPAKLWKILPPPPPHTHTTAYFSHGTGHKTSAWEGRRTGRRRSAIGTALPRSMGGVFWAGTCLL